MLIRCEEKNLYDQCDSHNWCIEEEVCFVVLCVCVCVRVFFSFFGFADACFENKKRHRLQRESRGNFGVVCEWVVVLQVGWGSIIAFLVLILWGWVVVGLWSLCVCVCVCVCVQIFRVYSLVAELFFLCLTLCCFACLLPFAISAAFAGF